MTNIRPLHDRVIIERVKERTTEGGIVIPDSVDGEKPVKGKIIAVGKGKLENGTVRALDVKVGDEVLYGKYSGTEVKVDGDELLVLREEDIMGVIEG